MVGGITPRPAADHSVSTSIHQHCLSVPAPDTETVPPLHPDTRDTTSRPTDPHDAHDGARDAAAAYAEPPAMSSGTDANANGGSAGRASAELPGVLSPPSVSSPIPRSSTDSARDPGPRDGESVEAQLERVKQEKEHLNHQYRSLLSKLTAMRQSLGDKLKEDAEELDRRELQIAEL